MSATPALSPIAAAVATVPPRNLNLLEAILIRPCTGERLSLLTAPSLDYRPLGVMSQSYVRLIPARTGKDSRTESGKCA